MMTPLCFPLGGNSHFTFFLFSLRRPDLSQKNVSGNRRVLSNKASGAINVGDTRYLFIRIAVTLRTQSHALADSEAAKKKKDNPAAKQRN